MTTKWCCLCGRQGHHANACDWPRNIPPTPQPKPEPVPEDTGIDEDWQYMYGGY